MEAFLFGVEEEEEEEEGVTHGGEVPAVLNGFCMLGTLLVATCLFLEILASLLADSVSVPGLRKN